MITAIAPVWDGNETWLVLGGGGLMAAFPLAYCGAAARSLRAAHRHASRVDLPRRRLRVPPPQPERHLRTWTRGFVLGSYVATFSQGVALGAFIQGVDGRAAAPMPAAGSTG